MNYNIVQTLPNNYIIAFLIGMLSAYPSLMPTALSLKEASLKDHTSCDLYKEAHMEDMFIQLPIMYGVLHVVLFFLILNLVPKSWQTYWLLGFIIAIIYPTLGTIGGHAKRVYGINSTPKLYMGAQILYLIFYGIIVNYLVNNL